jgi:hypothetical protein
MNFWSFRFQMSWSRFYDYEAVSIGSSCFILSLYFKQATTTKYTFLPMNILPTPT